MSSRGPGNLHEVVLGVLGVLVGVGLIVQGVDDGIVGIVGIVWGVVEIVCGVFFAACVVVVEVGERRRAQASAHLRALSPPAAPRSLRWVGGLLPGDEGADWLAEVGSFLAETTDKGERGRYVRSYRRNVPRLIWTSWTEHLRRRVPGSRSEHQED